ncbi:SDR family oxidoreductase [Isoptericola aurantiacus]|uniref:SDR family oxidoreductase n=1 Tax=Isoptericola aurantiacus TaxID=3377839 RepID=UPI00383B0991
MRLQQDTILITGGTSGIGLEMATRLAERGNTVIVTGRSEDRLAEFRRTHPSLHALAVEVTDRASVEQLYRAATAEFPGLNILINNAGMMQAIDFATASVDHITDEISVNLAGPVLVTQVFLPHLLEQPESAVLNVTSGIAYFPFEKAPLYSASKLGLHSYTQSLRAQLEGTSVAVYELAPPRTTQPMFSGSEADNAQVDRVPMMPVADVVAHMITGMRKNRSEIRPGMSKLLRLIGKIRL